MNRRNLLSFVSFPFAASLCFRTHAANLDPQSFETQMVNATTAINRWTALYQNKEGYWYKQWLYVSDQHVDAIRTQSVLRPLVGTLKTRVKVMFGVARETRETANMETVVAEDTKTGRKNEYAIDYDLKFAPKGNSWVFFEGKSHTSMQNLMGDDSWVTLTAADLLEKSSMHTLIIGIFSTLTKASGKSRKREPQI